ncbi:MAG: right-handed parallel beta-helix repeat-containing protein [Chitinophagaceae bacterium]|nr:right-handed parallel beta-helix repeat-containing protein [Chitinophagaceae bacterium]
MRRILLLPVLVIFTLVSADAKTAPVIRLQAGMVIRESSVVSREHYQLNAPNTLSYALIEIAGENIVIDFNEAVLQGSGDKSRPDEFYGLAIRIRKGSRNITLKNAVVHGYKIAILADSVENLRIDGADLSYNWRQHLQSNREREDVSDWMSYHHNENGEWMRYGAAIYLSACKAPVITNTTVTGGQCALMMTRCEKATVADNVFTFNSGIGIGLYRSSHNSIYHNRLDFNIRGYSEGFYKRGQDSAAILVFEQSSDNIFAYNTATHSGDGFFLWAGQTTMDTGTGGCNDNLIYGNDFSYAPTNGIEITFSRNLVMKNIVRNCDHGIWGGYSFETDITDNSFEDNRIAIAIEHGQSINIALNGFKGDRTGIKLWSREKQPDDWAYPKLRNSESRNYWVAANRFTSVAVAYDIMGTDTVVLNGNSKLDVGQTLLLGERVENIDTSREEDFLDMEYQKDERLKSIPDSAMPVSVLPEGREQMRITEWGPYDFRYPLLWLRNIDSSGNAHFEVLGPGGKWRISKHDGYEILSQSADSFPSALVAKPLPSPERKIELVYEGPAFTDQFGKQQSSGAGFSYREFLPHAKWNVQWYRWDAAHSPAGGFAGFETVLNQAPVFSAAYDKIDFTWWGAIGRNLPSDSFATVATTTMELPEADYEIGVTADDFVKLFVDGKELIDAWDQKYTELDENTHHRIRIRLAAGEHHFRLVHAENTGLAMLMFYLKPAGS